MFNVGVTQKSRGLGVWLIVSTPATSINIEASYPYEVDLIYQKHISFVKLLEQIVCSSLIIQGFGDNSRVI